MHNTANIRTNRCNGHSGVLILLSVYRSAPVRSSANDENHIDDTCVFPDWNAIQKLVPMAWIVPISLGRFRSTTPAYQHNLTCLALEHRMSTWSSSQHTEEDMRHMKAKFFHHKDIAIRAISRSIRDEKGRSASSTVVDVLTFMIFEVRTNR